MCILNSLAGPCDCGFGRLCLPLISPAALAALRLQPPPSQHKPMLRLRPHGDGSVRLSGRRAHVAARRPGPLTTPFFPATGLCKGRLRLRLCGG